MKVQFCFNCSCEVIAEFDVVEKPTKEQCEAIESYIDEQMDQWAEENDGDFAEFDYWTVCYNAADEYLWLTENPVVKTFYL